LVVPIEIDHTCNQLFGFLVFIAKKLVLSDRTESVAWFKTTEILEIVKCQKMQVFYQNLHLLDQHLIIFLDIKVNEFIKHSSLCQTASFSS